METVFPTPHPFATFAPTIARALITPDIINAASCCPVCFELVSSVASTPCCQARFCRTCLEFVLARTDGKCPVCPFPLQIRNAPQISIEAGVAKEKSDDSKAKGKLS